jgi:hypothetical protein
MASIDLQQVAALIELCRRTGAISLSVGGIRIGMGPAPVAPGLALEADAPPVDDGARYAHTNLRPPNLRALRGDS